MSRPRIAVVTAGLSVPSSTRLLADRLAAAAAGALDERGTAAQIEVVELREYARDLADHLVTGFPGRRLRDALDSVVHADGLVAVSPVFSASYSGLFKTFFDVLDKDALAGKPVLLAATGGTARHSLVLDHAMRPLFAYLHAFTVPTGVFAASEDWAGAVGPGRALSDRIGRATGELADLVLTRPRVGRADEFAEVTPFAELLRGA